MSNNSPTPRAPLTLTQAEREALFPDVYRLRPVRANEPHTWAGNATRSVVGGASEAVTSSLAGAVQGVAGTPEALFSAGEERLAQLNQRIAEMETGVERTPTIPSFLELMSHGGPESIPTSNWDVTLEETKARRDQLAATLAQRRQELEGQRAKGPGVGDRVASAIRQTGEDYSKLLDVDPEFANTTAGGVFKAIGGVPMYAGMALLPGLNVPLLMGGMYDESRDTIARELGYDPNNLTIEQAGEVTRRALPAAAANAALERVSLAFGPIKLLGRALGLGEDVKDARRILHGWQRAGQVGKESVKGAIAEGLTEMGQTGVNIFGASGDLSTIFDDKHRDELYESGKIGGIVGFLFGGAGEYRQIDRANAFTVEHEADVEVAQQTKDSIVRFLNSRRGIIFSNSDLGIPEDQLNIYTLRADNPGPHSLSEASMSKMSTEALVNVLRGLDSVLVPEGEAMPSYRMALEAAAEQRNRPPVSEQQREQSEYESELDEAQAEAGKRAEEDEVSRALADQFADAFPDFFIYGGWFKPNKDGSKLSERSILRIMSRINAAAVDPNASEDERNHAKSLAAQIANYIAFLSRTGELDRQFAAQTATPQQGEQEQPTPPTEGVQPPAIEEAGKAPAADTTAGLQAIIGEGGSEVSDEGIDELLGLAGEGAPTPAQQQKQPPAVQQAAQQEQPKVEEQQAAGEEGDITIPNPDVDGVERPIHDFRQVPMEAVRGVGIVGRDEDMKRLEQFDDDSIPIDFIYSKSPNARMVAARRTSNQVLLSSLAHDPSPGVRQVVAQRSASRSVLEYLAEDSDAGVRMYAADNLANRLGDNYADAVKRMQSGPGSNSVVRLRYTSKTRRDFLEDKEAPLQPLEAAKPLAPANEAQTPPQPTAEEQAPRQPTQPPPTPEDAKAAAEQAVQQAMDKAANSEPAAPSVDQQPQPEEKVTEAPSAPAEQAAQQVAEDVKPAEERPRPTPKAPIGEHTEESLNKLTVVQLREIGRGLGIGVHSRKRGTNKAALVASILDTQIRVRREQEKVEASRQTQEVAPVENSTLFAKSTKELASILEISQKIIEQAIANPAAYKLSPDDVKKGPAGYNVRAFRALDDLRSINFAAQQVAQSVWEVRETTTGSFLSLQDKAKRGRFANNLSALIAKAYADPTFKASEEEISQLADEAHAELKQSKAGETVPLEAIKGYVDNKFLAKAVAGIKGGSIKAPSKGYTATSGFNKSNLSYNDVTQGAGEEAAGSEREDINNPESKQLDAGSANGPSVDVAGESNTAEQPEERLDNNYKAFRRAYPNAATAIDQALRDAISAFSTGRTPKGKPIIRVGNLATGKRMEGIISSVREAAASRLPDIAKASSGDESAGLLRALAEDEGSDLAIRDYIGSFLSDASIHKMELKSPATPATTRTDAAQANEDDYGLSDLFSRIAFMPVQSSMLLTTSEVRDHIEAAGLPPTGSTTSKLIRDMPAQAEQRGASGLFTVGSLSVISRIFSRVESAANLYASMNGTASPFGSLKVEIKDMGDGEGGSYSLDTNTLTINTRLEPKAAALVFIHELGHFVAHHVIGERLLMSEWAKKSHSDRVEAVRNYLADGEAQIDIGGTTYDNATIDNVSPIVLLDSYAAAHEWYAMQFTRIISVSEQALAETKAAAKASGIKGWLLKEFESWREFIRKLIKDEYIGDSTLSSVELDEITTGLLGYEMDANPYSQRISAARAIAAQRGNRRARFSRAKQSLTLYAPRTGKSRFTNDILLPRFSRKAEESRRIACLEGMATVKDFQTRVRELFDRVKKLQAWTDSGLSVIPDENLFTNVIFHNSIDTPKALAEAHVEEAVRVLNETPQSAQTLYDGVSFKSLITPGNPSSEDSARAAANEAARIYQFLVDVVADRAKTTSDRRGSISKRIDAANRAIAEAQKARSNPKNRPSDNARYDKIIADSIKERDKSKESLKKLDSVLSVYDFVGKEVYQWLENAMADAGYLNAELNAAGGVGSLDLYIHPPSPTATPEEIMQRGGKWTDAAGDTHRIFRKSGDTEDSQMTLDEKREYVRALSEWLYDESGAPRVENQKLRPIFWSMLRRQHDIMIENIAKTAFQRGRGFLAASIAYMRPLATLCEATGIPAIANTAKRQLFRYTEKFNAHSNAFIAAGRTLDRARARAIKACFGGESKESMDRFRDNIFRPAVDYLEGGRGTKIDGAMLHLEVLSARNKTLAAALSKKDAKARVRAFLEAHVENDRVMKSPGTLIASDIRMQVTPTDGPDSKVAIERQAIAQSGLGTATMRMVRVPIVNDIANQAAHAGLTTVRKHNVELNEYGVPTRDTGVVDPAPKQGEINALALYDDAISSGAMGDAEAQKNTNKLLVDLFGVKVHEANMSGQGIQVSHSLFNTFITWYAKSATTRVWRTQDGGVADFDSVMAALDEANKLDPYDDNRAVVFFRALYDNASNPTGGKGKLGYYRWLNIQLDALREKADAIQTIAIESSPLADESVHLPGRAVMDARSLEDIPGEMWDYYEGGEDANKQVLAKIAFNTAFGRDGVVFFGAINSAYEEIKAMQGRHEALTQEAKDNGVDVGDAKALEDYVVKTKKVPRAEWRRLLPAETEALSLSVNRAMMAFISQWQHDLSDVAEARPLDEVLATNMTLTLSGIKSSVLQTTQVAMPLAQYGLSEMGVHGVGKSVKFTFANICNSLLQAIGSDRRLYVDYVHRIEALLGKDPDHVGFFANVDAAMKSGGVRGRYRTGVWGAVYRGARTVRAALNSPISPRGKIKGDAPLLAPNLFGYANSVLRHAAIMQEMQVVDDLVSRAAKFIQDNANNNRVFQSPGVFAPGFRFSSKDLGYTGGWKVGNDMAYAKLVAKLEDRIGTPLEHLALNYISKKTGPNGNFLTNDQYQAVAQLARDEFSLEGTALTTRPAHNSSWKRRLSAMLGWTIEMTKRFLIEPFTDSTGEITKATFTRGVITHAFGTLPTVLMISMLRDFFDEWLTGKKNNIPPLTGDAGDIVRSVAARLARDNMYGVWAELLFSVSGATAASGDMRGSLVNRVYLVNMLQQAMQLADKVIDQEGNATFASVYRPMLCLSGGTGFFQNMDVVDEFLDLDNPESRYVNLVSTRNIIRAYGPPLGFEVAATVSGEAQPWTPYISNMGYAACGGNMPAFYEAREAAIKACIDDGFSREEAAQKVTDSYARRHPLKSMLRGSLSTADYNRLIAGLPEHLRDQFVRSIYGYNQGMVLLGKNAFVGEDRGRAKTSPDSARTRRPSSNDWMSSLDW